MDEEQKELLEKTYRLAKENNKMIHKLQSRARWSTIVSLVKWIIIIVIAYGSYVVLQPFIDQAREVFISLQTTADSISDIKTQADEGFGGFKDFFNR